jgi:hypothetical protein
MIHNREPLLFFHRVITGARDIISAA